MHSILGHRVYTSFQCAMENEAKKKKENEANIKILKNKIKTQIVNITEVFFSMSHIELLFLKLLSMIMPINLATDTTLKIICSEKSLHNWQGPC